MNPPAADPASPGPHDTLAPLVTGRRVLVCCGTGGVGKTTTAAALALAAARRGRRAVVVTIDPARRLADALGIGGLDNRPRTIDGIGPGRLAAMMLDTKSTFDDLVRRHARDEAQARHILANPFYRNVSGGLSGTQDYMAAEKLHELYASGDWDLVVVDTPPSRDALAFLDAPRLLTRLLDNPVYRVLTAPNRGILRAVNQAAQNVVRQLSRVVGADVVDEAVAFFQAFEGMEAGFRARAESTLALLGDPRTAFVLVTSPRPDVMAEARWFSRRLTDARLEVGGVVVNRALPPVGTPPDEAARIADLLADSALAPTARALAEHSRALALERERITELATWAPGAPLVTVPLLDVDVHDLDTLDEIARRLVVP